MNELDIYKILSNHLVETWGEKYNELVDVVIHNVEKIDDKLVFYTNIDTIEVPIASKIEEMENVKLNDLTEFDILQYDGTNWVNTTIDSGFDYSSDVPSTRPEFSDIKSVSSLEDFIDQVLYPYQYPAFGSFSISGQSSTLELGQYMCTSGDTKTFTWNVSYIDNVDSDIGYMIQDTTNSVILESGILPKTANSNTITMPSDIVKDSVTSHTFRISSINTKNNEFSRNYSVSWRPRMYWGVSSQTSLTSADVLNLSGSKLTTSSAGTYVINGGGQYIYFVVGISDAKSPLINSDGSNSKFVVGNLPNSAFLRSNLTHTNAYGHVSEYYVYRTTTIQSGSGIEIKIV